MAGDSTEEVRRFTSALQRPFGDERPQIVAQADLQQRFSSTAREPLERVLELGFLRTLGDGRFEEVTPQAWRGAEVFAELGVPVEELVAVATEARGHIDAIATAFMRLFVEHVWKPFEVAGRPEEGLERVLDAIERLRPLGRRPCSRCSSWRWAKPRISGSGPSSNDSSSGGRSRRS